MRERGVRFRGQLLKENANEGVHNNSCCISKKRKKEKMRESKNTLLCKLPVLIRQERMSVPASRTLNM